jgi:hypothetical protein
MDVAAHVETMRRTPFAWGRFDCITALADWSFALGAGDPAADYRGRYATPLGAQKIIRKAGGLGALVGREFERCGWVRTSIPAAGDIGLVTIKTDHGPAEAGGLCLGDRWAVLFVTGVMVGQFAPVSVWRSPCLKP